MEKRLLVLVSIASITCTLRASDVQQILHTPGKCPDRPDIGSYNLMPLFGDTLLHMAASLGDSELLSKMIEDGMAINSINGQGYTPLDCALVNRKDRQAILLLEHGAYSNVHQHVAPFVMPLPFKNKIIAHGKKGGSIVIITLIVWLAWYLFKDEEPAAPDDQIAAQENSHE